MNEEMEEMRQKILNEVGPGMMNYPAMVMEVIEIENAKSKEELRQIARRNDVDISEFDDYSLGRKW